MNNQDHQYRDHLVSAEQRSVEQYDKALLTLSASALGLSFTFLRQIVGDRQLVLPGVLFAAWLSWALSLASVLVSFYVSHKALRKAIAEVDSDTLTTGKTPARRLSCVTELATALGGVFFLIGVLLMAVFVWKNLGVQ